MTVVEQRRRRIFIALAGAIGVAAATYVGWGHPAPTILAWLVILVAVPLNWYVALRLGRVLWVDRANRVLLDRFLVAIELAGIVSLFGLIFLNNEMPTPFLDIEATRIITRSAVLGLSLPPLYWLWLYGRE